MLHDKHGNPLNVGRRTRAISPALRRALRERDGGCCQFTGCTERRWVDAHHVRHWAHGGETKLDNLVNLCRFHHRLVHEGGYQIAILGPGRFQFLRPDGRRIPTVPTQGGTADAVRQAHTATITPTTVEPRWYGDKLDLDFTIHALLAAEERAQRQNLN